MDFFTKTDRHAPDGFFAAEAAGLHWLREAGGVAVVEVIRFGADHLTLQRLHPGRAEAVDAEQFGRTLASTHAAGAPSWGAPPPGTDGRGFIGPLPQTNHPVDTWGRFYAGQRIRPFADQALRQRSLDSTGHTVIRRLCDHLEAGTFDDDLLPARIHGDLWSGNVITTPGGWTLIDPAAHGGHPLTDLAMLTLFGNPHLSRTLAAYAESALLPDRWRELLPLHQVHPLLVHAVLFGGGYARQAITAAESYC